MGWQDIIATPLFWIVSTIGTLVLSILGNLLTPCASAFVTRRLYTRRTGLREKQKKRRDQVITLEKNIDRRTSTKLDAVLKLLLATVLLLACILPSQIASYNPAVLLSPAVRLPILLVIALDLVLAAILSKLGIDDVLLALSADSRERARNDFLAERGPAANNEIGQFEDKWDLKEFGVNSQS